MSSKLKLLKSKPDDCVLVLDTVQGVYKVVDAENYTICLTQSYDTAVEEFNNYSLKEVRRARRAMFDEWLKRNVEG